MKRRTKVFLIAIVAALGLLSTVSVTYLAVTSYQDRAEAKAAERKAQFDAAQRRWKEEACDYGADVAMNMVAYRSQGMSSYSAGITAQAVGRPEKGDHSGKMLGVFLATDDDVVRYVYGDSAPGQEDTRRFALGHCRTKIFEPAS